MTRHHRHNVERPAKRMAPIESPIKQYPDIIPKCGVQIKVRHDGLVVWINVDGVCVMRLFTANSDVPIEIEDNRPKP